MVKTCGAECGSVGPWHLVGVRTEGSSESESGVAQLCPTLRNPMDCSLSGSSIHGRDRTQVSCIADRRFTI